VRVAGSSIPRRSTKGDPMDSLDVIFMICAVIWLCALFEYF
jgi:hypothetical protein